MSGGEFNSGSPRVGYKHLVWSSDQLFSHIPADETWNRFCKKKKWKDFAFLLFLLSQLVVYSPNLINIIYMAKMNLPLIRLTHICNLFFLKSPNFNVPLDGQRIEIHHVTLW